MSIDAMQQALEALEYHQEQTRPIHKTQETITALRQAIEEAEQWDTTDMAHRAGGLTIEQTPDDLLRQSEREGWRYAKECEAEIKRLKELAEYRLQLLMKIYGNELDAIERGYFAGKKDGIDETIALIRRKNNATSSQDGR
jgi:hypothetical protein